MKSKSTFTRVVIITAAVTAGCLGIAAVIGITTAGFVPGRLEAATTVDESKSIPLSGVDLVSIRSVSDEVRIIEGTGGAIQARLHGTVSSSSPDAQPRLSAERSGSTVEIRLERTSLFTFGFAWNHLVLEVSIPKGYRGKLEARSVSADLDVAEHAYQGLALATTSGSMRAGAVTASEFSARTTSGDLAVEALRAEQISAVSVSGSLTIGVASAPRRLQAESTSGTVTVLLPSDASFTLDAHSTSGDVRCAFPIVVERSRNGGGDHLLAGKVGTGAGLVAVRTVSGDIRVTP
jgi:DUF4097 and DUF4098 domain-containing protein YvlB